MPTVVPPGENLRRAVKWISEQRQERPDEKLSKLVDEAAIRFDLSPKDQEFLVQTFTAGS